MTSAIEREGREDERATEPSEGPGRSMARSAFHLVLGQVAMTALALVLSAALGRGLGPSDFGILYLIGTIVGFALNIIDWGQSMYVVSEVALDERKAGALLGSALMLRVLGTLVATAVVAGAMALLGYDAITRNFALLAMGAMLPFALASAYSIVFRGRQRMDYSASVDVANRIIQVALTLPILWLGGRLFSIIVIQGIAGVGALAVAAWLYRRVGLPRVRAGLHTARSLMVGGTPLVAMSLAIAFHPYVDATVLSKLAPPLVVGWYGAAKNFMSVLTAPAAILGTASFPRLSEARGRPEEFRRELRTAMRPLLVIASLGMVGTYLFADLAVSVVYSKQKFGPAIPVLQVFAPGLLLLFIDMQLGFAILAAGRSLGLAIAKAVSVVLGAALDVLLIPWCQARFGNGGIGVVLSYNLSELVMIVAALILIPRGALDRRSLADAARALVAGAGALAATWFLRAVSPILALPLCIALFGALCVALRLVTREDLVTLRGLLRRQRGSPPATVAPE
jgi:O-antigen/teichoic acid export membrane protein